MAVLLIAATAMAAAPRPGAAPAAAVEEPPAELPAAVQAVLASKPTTPSDFARVAAILADLEQPKLAREFFKKILDAKLDADALAALGEQIGTATFVGLAERPALQPEAKMLSDAVGAAVAAKVQQPQRIAGLIKQLADPAEQKQYAALAGLTEARSAAVGPLVAALADPAQQPQRPLLRAAMKALGSDAIGPLGGLLESDDPATAAAAIRALGELRAGQAALFLLAPAHADDADPAVRAAAGAVLPRALGRAPDRSGAAAMLAAWARDYFDRRRPPAGVSDGQATLWAWDAAKKQAASQTMPADDAQRALAARLARDAYRLAPADADVRRLHLATMFEEAAYLNGLDKPLPPDAPAAAAAAKLGSRAVEDVLQYAMATGHPVAATAAARIIGQIGKAEELLLDGPRPTPLAAAAQHADRRLRFAAVEAMVRLKPQRPFAGSSYVVEALAYFAATTGQPRALLAGPITADMREMAGVLAARGFVVESAVAGRPFLQAIAASPDWELAILDVQIDRPSVEFVLQDLRREPCSADLRVGLMARSGYFEFAEKLARRDGRALPFHRPHDDDSIAWQLERLATLGPREFVGHEARQQQAAAALAMLGELAAAGGKLFDLQRAQPSVLSAMTVPTLAAAAVEVAGRLNAWECQQALVELASRVGAPITLRKAAAKAFDQSVQKHGLLLTTVEIARQYDRYNSSGALGVETQQVLSKLLNSIEAPTQALRSPPAADSKPAPAAAKQPEK